VTRARSVVRASCSLALAVVVASPLFAQKAAADPELATAREKFGQPQEGECTAATDICVKKNNVAAVELMLEVLRLETDRSLPAPHYRDVVWGGLARITDPYARQRVEVELKTNKESAWVRQWCAELLGEYGDSTFGESLAKALGDKELDVQRAAARALGRVRSQAGVKPLTNLIGEHDAYLRESAFESLARIDPKANRAMFLRGMKDKEGGVRCALLGAALEIYPDELEAWSVLALADKDWRPRMQAVDNLGTIRTKTGVDALIGALADGRPAVVERAMQRLSELTGQKHTRADSWRSWWQANRETLAFPDGAAKAEPFDPSATATYHGIKLVSDHVAFLIDKSDDMKKDLAATKTSKEDAAYAELKSVLGKLSGRVMFNVLAYAETVTPFLDQGPIELTPRNRERALEFLKAAPEGKAKDIWKLLEVVLGDDDIDTAYLLSSGEPDIGEYVHWNRVSWHLRDVNRFRKLVVHTIAYSDSEWYRSQLEKIAEVTGGEFKWFE
jgi:hypothetical protein